MIGLGGNPSNLKKGVVLNHSLNSPDVLKHGSSVLVLLDDIKHNSPASTIVKPILVRAMILRRRGAAPAGDQPLVRTTDGQARRG